MAYQWELSKIEELTQNELNNEKTLADLEGDSGNFELLHKTNNVLHDQISLLREKNSHLLVIVQKLEKFVQISNNESPRKESKVINIEQLDILQESALHVCSTKVSNNEKEFELENPETYGKDLSDYIDKLNNNIELIKKAFNQTSLELEKPPVLNMEESEIHGDEILQEKEEFTRKKEKSLLVTPADFGNEAQRKFNSFNSMYRVNLEHVENALENSTFSLSLLNKRLREYPEKIRFLEEQIQKIYKDRDVANEKIEVLMKNESDLMKNLNEFNEKVQILEGKNKALESEIEQKEVIIKTHANTIENFEKKEKNVHDIHYKIENSLNNSSEKPNAKDAKIEIMDRKNCCKIF